MTPSFPARFNLADHLLDENLRRGFAARPAILTPERNFTYAEVIARVNRAAVALRRAGVRRGDRVITMLPDGIDFVASLFGTLKLGAVVAMANPELPAGDHEALMDYTGARAVVTTAAVAGRLAASPSPIRGKNPPALFAAAGRGEAAIARTPSEGAENPDRATGAMDWDVALGAIGSEGDGFSTEPTGPDDDAFWLFTSGSTGRPKAAIHRHRDFAAHIECFVGPILGLSADDITFAIPRLYFPYATGMNLMFPFAVGASAVLCSERPTAERVFALCERFSPTVLSTVPTMTAKLLALAAQSPATSNLASVRLTVSAGEALPPDLFRRWTAGFGDMIDAIGSAEMFHIYISNRPGHAKPGSLGRAIPGYQAKIVRQADGGAERPAADCEIGTLWVRGPSAARGYHADPESSEAVFKNDGWVVTGDVFTRDPSGDFHYQGRTDDLLKVGGIYVSPLELEAALREHPAVADCVVVGHADEHGLEKPRAFIVVNPGYLADAPLFAALTEFARTRLAHFKVPRSWIAVDALPRNDRGKVIRRVLRAR